MAYHRLHLLLFLALLSSAAAQHLQRCQQKQSCPRGSVSIEYPFHMQTKDNFYCGYEEFQVSCDGPDLTMNILNDEFHVKNVSYINQYFSVVYSDSEASNCSRVEHSLNVSMLSPTFDFQFNDNVFLGFFLNCSNSSFLNPFPRNTIDCFSRANRSKKSYVIKLPSTDRDKSFSWNGICENYFVVPVNKKDADDSDNIGKDFGFVLGRGFALKWRVSHSSFCAECESSKGFCGFNKTTEKPLCICNNDFVAVNATCNSASTKNNSFSPAKKALIGVVSALGLILLAIISWFIFARITNKNNVIPSFDQRSIRKKSVKASQYLGVRIFSFAELEEATNHFDESREVGEGGFGAVYYGKLRDGRSVAVKRLYERSYKRVTQFMNEVEILTRLSHRHLVTLYGCTSQHSRDLLLVYEYVENGTVSEHLRGKKPLLRWKVRMRIAVETASALAYLHACDIIHRDVKTCNILLDDNCRVKVADFGLSRLFPMDATHVSTAPQGTPGYVDPEYHKSYQLTEKSDVFSFGVVLGELISSLPAVDITRPLDEINLYNMAIDRIRRNKLRELVDPALGFEEDIVVERTVSAVAELAFRCLQEAKGERPSMDEVYESLKQIQAMGKCADEDDPAIIELP